MRIVKKLTHFTLVSTSMVFTLQIEAKSSDSQTTVPNIKPVLHGPRDQKKIALTFDACSTKKNEFDAEIVEVLNATNTPATLFVGGVWLQNNIENIEPMKRNPLFEWALHGHDHLRMDKIKEAKALDDFRNSLEVFKKNFGFTASLYRPPFGNYSSQTLDLAHMFGMKTIMWNLASGDADPKFHKERLRKWVVSSARIGSIVVLHMNKNGWHTAKALPLIINDLKLKGFEFAKVSELLESGGSTEKFALVD